MRRLGQLLVFMFLAVGTHLAAKSQNTCDADTLPPQAKSLVTETFPGWRLKQTSDLEGYDRELWTKAHPKDCPGIAVGHFEFSDQTAYAIVLIPKSQPESGYKIVVLAKSTSAERYSVKVLDHNDGQAGASSGLVISKLPPGEYSGFDTTQSIKTKLDAFEAEWLEKSSVLYFWRNGRYRTLQTSD